MERQDLGRRLSHTILSAYSLILGQGHLPLIRIVLTCSHLLQLIQYSLYTWRFNMRLRTTEAEYKLFISLKLTL